MSTFLTVFFAVLVVGGPALYGCYRRWPDITDRVLDFGADAARIAAPHKGIHVPPLDERLAAMWKRYMLRERAAAACASPDGPAPVLTPQGAGPLTLERRDGVIEIDGDEVTVRPSTDATAPVNPYPALTEPLAALREQMEPVPAARPFVVIAEKYMP